MARPKKEKAAEPKAAAPEAASAKVNKSLAVRDYLALHPKATPKDVSAALKDQGLDVSPNYVSIVKFQMKKSKGKSKAKKAEAASAAPPQEKKAAPRQVSDKFSIETLLQAKKLSESLGGVEAAREALAALSKLLG